jgi:hypothetical protein
MDRPVSSGGHGVTQGFPSFFVLGSEKMITRRVGEGPLTGQVSQAAIETRPRPVPPAWYSSRNLRHLLAKSARAEEVAANSGPDARYRTDCRARPAHASRLEMGAKLNFAKTDIDPDRKARRLVHTSASSPSRGAERGQLAAMGWRSLNRPKNLNTPLKPRFLR